MKKNIFGRNDVEARASVRTPSYTPVRHQELVNVNVPTKTEVIYR